MRHRSSLTALLLGCVGLFTFAMCGQTAVRAATLKLEVQLLWGTNDEHSPDPRHKPVEPEVQAKLKDLPLKWTHYFEVRRKNFEVPPSGHNKVSLSQKCQIEVKNLGDPRLEIVLFGKGKETLRRTQSLSKGEMLVLGGNAPNSTAWLVVLKRME
jgi:hypothetical protein